ncbi:MAG: hypothetical protein J7497_10780 [Chitinophagaceae bacterium]|nr:hypothetical protein [Chitinophagaceae bacterium]
MPNSQLSTAISTPRFNRYLTYCQHNKARALKLYRANLILSQKLYCVIGLFEIILRNSIDRHYRNHFGDNWMAQAVQPGGLFDGPGCEQSYHAIQEIIHALNTQFDEDSAVARSTFGFWTYQFSPKVFAATGSTLLNIFSRRPYGTKQKDIFQHLFKINEIRNRIAHYEPICMESRSQTISTGYALRRYDLIIELLKWLGCDPGKILYGVDGVVKIIKKINAL